MRVTVFSVIFISIIVFFNSFFYRIDYTLLARFPFWIRILVALFIPAVINALIIIFIKPKQFIINPLILSICSTALAVYTIYLMKFSRTFLHAYFNYPDSLLTTMLSLSAFIAFPVIYWGDIFLAEISAKKQL